MDTIHCWYSDVVRVCVCMYLILCKWITCAGCLFITTVGDWTNPTVRIPRVALLYPQPLWPLFTPPSHPCRQLPATANLSSISKILSLQKCQVNGTIRCATFWDWIFPQNNSLEIYPSGFVYQWFAPFYYWVVFHGMEILLVLFSSGAVFFSLLPFWVMTVSKSTHDTICLQKECGQRWEEGGLLQVVFSFWHVPRDHASTEYSATCPEQKSYFLSPGSQTISHPTPLSVNSTTMYPVIQAKILGSRLLSFFHLPPNLSPNTVGSSFNIFLFQMFLHCCHSNRFGARQTVLGHLSPGLYSWNVAALWSPSCPFPIHPCAS